MERMTFRKSFLVSGILFFLVLVSGQSAWACETPDYNDYQCYEELDIKKVHLDYDKDLIYIFGRNFKNGAFPVVTLGDDGLVVQSYNDKEIVQHFRVWKQVTINWSFLQAAVINAKTNNL